MTMRNFFSKNKAQEEDMPKNQPSDGTWWVTTIPSRNINPDYLIEWLDLHFGQKEFDLEIKWLVFEICAPRSLKQVRPCNTVFHLPLFIASINRKMYML